MKTSFSIAHHAARGFKPLKWTRYDKPTRGGVVGFVLFAQDNLLYVSAVYDNQGVERIGEPCQLPGLKVYLRAKAARPAGIYNLRGERIELSLKDLEGFDHG